MEGEYDKIDAPPLTSGLANLQVGYRHADAKVGINVGKGELSYHTNVVRG